MLLSTGHQSTAKGNHVIAVRKSIAELVSAWLIVTAQITVGIWEAPS